MKTKSLFGITAFAALLALLANSCVIDPSDGGPQVTDDTAVRLSLSVPEARTATRGLTGSQESNVESVHVLVFDTSDKFLYYKPASGVTNSSETVKTFEVRLGLGTFNLVFIVNATAEINTLGLDSRTGQDKSVIMPLLVKSSTGKWSGNIPMWGYRDNVTISETPGLTSDLSSTANAIKLARMLSKIDVEVSPAAAGKSAGVNKNFKLTSVRLYNYNTKGHIVPEPIATYWNPTLNEAIAPMPNTTGAVTGADNPLAYLISQESGTYDGVNPFADQDGMHNVIYAFEAAAGGGGTSLPTNTCLVVGGSYREGGDETSFYRVDFRDIDPITNAVTYLPLLRNWNYTIDINSVTGPGLPSPKEAFESVPVNFDATVTAYPAGQGGQSIVYDGTNRMWLDRDMIFCGNEGTVPGVDIVVTINSTATAENLIVTGPEYPQGTTPWLTPANHTTSATTSTTAEGVSVKQTTITVRDLPAYTGGTAEREAWFWVQSGNMRYNYRIVQSHEPWLRVRENIFLLDGTVQSLTVTSKTDWAAQVKDVAYNNIVNGTNLITKLATTAGKQGTDKLPFATYDDIYTGTRSMGVSDVVLTFTHGDYLSKDITITAVSAYFGKESNCYMMDWNNPMAVLIPVSQIGRAMSTTSTAPAPDTGLLPSNWVTDADFTSSTAPLLAQVLWTDVQDGASGNGLFDNLGAVVRKVVLTGSSLSDASIVVVPGKPYVESGVKGGNSLVILYKDNNNNGFYDTGDEIKWSWHIWNTDYVAGGTEINPLTKPASDGKYAAVNGGHLYRFGTNNNNTWMDRNLGAIGGNVKPAGINKDYELGFHYQWGRKDPQPGSNMATSTSAANRTNIYYAPTVPTALRYDNSTTKGTGLVNAVNWPQWHNYNTVSPYDWYGATSCYELWGQPSSTTAAWNAISTAKFVDQTTGKSAYDPCPEGWRVPRGQQGSADTYSPWNGWLGQTFPQGQGYDNASYGYWPAAGYRSTVSSGLGTVGGNGYYWSSSLYSANTAYSRSLYFNYSNGINPSSYYYRGHGFSVRCVAE